MYQILWRMLTIKFMSKCAIDVKYFYYYNYYLYHSKIHDPNFPIFSVGSYRQYTIY